MGPGGCAFLLSLLLGEPLRWRWGEADSFWLKKLPYRLLGHCTHEM